MAALFQKPPKPPKTPKKTDKQIDDERRKALLRASHGRASTILTSASTRSATLLGDAASLVGGTL